MLMVLGRMTSISMRILRGIIVMPWSLSRILNRRRRRKGRGGRNTGCDSTF